MMIPIKINISQIFETILKYFRELVILVLIVIIIFLRGCGKEVNIQLDQNPMVKDSIIYVPDSSEVLKRITAINTVDSLRLILRLFKDRPCPDIVADNNNKIVKPEASRDSNYVKDIQRLSDRLMNHLDECEDLQDLHYQANFYLDTLRNDSIFLMIKEEVAENKIQSRNVIARFTLTKHKPRLQLYAGGSLGFGKSPSLGLHFTVLPKNQKFSLSYYNQSNFGDSWTNSHNIAVQFRIRK